MIRSTLKSIANKLAAVSTAALLILLSAAALTFGFFLSFSLLVVSVVWGLFGRSRRTQPEDSVIDLGEGDYQHIKQ